MFRDVPGYSGMFRNVLCSGLYRRPAHKPITTLRQLLSKVKNKDEPNDRQHHLQTNHRIDWDSAECVIYSTE